MVVLALTVPSVHPTMNQKQRQVRSPLPSQRLADDTNIAHKWQFKLVHNQQDTPYNRCVKCAASPSHKKVKRH